MRESPIKKQKAITWPPTPAARAARSVMMPLFVETIVHPNPLNARSLSLPRYWRRPDGLRQQPFQ